MEASEAKQLIDEAIERADEKEGAEHVREREQERRFRDRVSLLVGGFAVLLALIHTAASSTARESLTRTVEASDTFAYMQSKIIRETVLHTGAAGAGVGPTDRAAMLAEAGRLRAPDRAGHGIKQLERQGDELRAEGQMLGRRSEGYEAGETALQLAIVLLSIALVAQSRRIVIGAVALAALGAATALATLLGLAAPW